MEETKITKVKSPVTKKGTRNQDTLADAHPGHDKHLCHIVNMRNMKTLAKLSKDAKHICYICGRAAKNKDNLCVPVEI